MFKKLFVPLAISALYFAGPVMAEDLNQPQDHRSTINQQQSNQVGQPIDNRIDSEIKQNQANTPITPQNPQPLPATPPSRSVMTPEPPPPPTRINPQTPQTNDPSVSNSGAPAGTTTGVPNTTYPDTTYPDDTTTPYR